MKIILTTALLLLWATSAFAKPIIVRWKPYIQGQTPAVRFELHRSINGGTYQFLVTVPNVSSIEYVDENVKWNRYYCYQLYAVAQSGIKSLPSNWWCTRPNK